MTIGTQAGTSFTEVLTSRRSVRHYDPSFKISDEEIKEILELATKAPSSANTQSWRFLVVTDQALKDQLLPIANNQQQVVDASAVVVILGDMEFYTKLGEINDAAVKAGYMTQEIAQRFTENYQKLFPSIPKDRLTEIVAFDAGLVSMQIMLAAKSKGYDTVPMGGYDRDKLRTFFEIPDRYLPLLVLPIGKAKEEGRPTVRLPLEEITFWNGVK
ncbi:nitroreductase family protein [Paenibacillus glycanilyticus]|uniref:nitroreductase family protein n=1 Tax=Paenibacillus glycanilyticus TaxID=126569 RepID=UPI00203EF5C5|nr:nitroreductase family protein [Paenibacillus glycanilyticus]MCM3629379.1 nitroreductase family protein [Paenibacillus glycanilyticus]